MHDKSNKNLLKNTIFLTGSKENVFFLNECKSGRVSKGRDLIEQTS